MNAYVAGSTRDIHAVQKVIAEVQAANHTITFDWTGPERNIRSDWSKHASEAEIHSQREVAAAKCELFVLVTPQHKGGVGCFIEFGIALGNGALCYVLPFKDRDSVFFYHPNVYIVKSSKALRYALTVANTRHWHLTHKQ
jgi:hypothetical protein